MENAIILGIMVILFDALRLIAISSYQDFGVNAVYDPIVHSPLEGKVWGSGSVIFFILGVFAMISSWGIYIYLILLAILHNWVIALVTFALSYLISPLISLTIEKLTGTIFGKLAGDKINVNRTNALMVGRKLLIVPILIVLPLYFAFMIVLLFNI